MDKKTLYVQKNDLSASLRKMLSLVGKESCKNSKDKISKTIGCFDDNSDIIMFMDIDYYRVSALSQLRKKHIKNQAENSASYDKFLKKISTFRNSLKKTLELMKDKTITEFLLYKARIDPEIPEKMLNEDYSKTYNRIHSLYYQMEYALSSKRNKGRTSLMFLYNYVYELAVLYKELSKKDFSVLRYKEAGEYKPITPGHEFIYIAIQLLNMQALEEGCKEIYTSNNIYNACEKAQKRFKLFF